jgi:hypothetical protein
MVIIWFFIIVLNCVNSLNGGLRLVTKPNLNTIPIPDPDHNPSPYPRFLVINCEDISWNPITFSEMYKLHLSQENDVWTTCNIASGEKLPDPEDILKYKGIVITGSHYNCRKRDSYFAWYEDLLTLIREISTAGYPKLFGGCFGHNLIALALG